MDGALELHEAIKVGSVGDGDFVARREAAGYLAAIIDGEGYVKLYRGTRKSGGREGQAKTDRRVSVTNTDAGIIAAVVAAAELLEIPYNLSRWYEPRLGQRKSYRRVEFCRREAFQALLRQVNLRCLDKRSALEEIVASYATREVCA